MSLSENEFSGTVSISLNSIMILPVFSTKVPTGFQQGGNTLYASDDGKKQDAAAGSGSFPFVSLPSKIAPELVLHLQNFRRN